RLVVRLEPHYDPALGGAPGALDADDRHADHGAARRDQHHLVAVANDARPDQPALALDELGRLDAKAAAALARVVRELRALAVAVLGDDEQVALVGTDDVHRDHLVALAQAHAFDAAGVAAHRARLLLGEAD